MMSGDISFDLGSALPYLEQRILGLFGRDSGSIEWNNRVKNLIRLSAEQASHVQCVGMHTPIPIGQIYQPTRLTRSGGLKEQEIEAAELLAASDDAIIFAGPGWGKTTLLHHWYCSLVNQDSTPILFTLRWETAVDDLDEFVSRLSQAKSSDKKLVLLVDGYDEITEKERLTVSRISGLPGLLSGPRSWAKAAIKFR
jgi:hypothetical protein